MTRLRTVAACDASAAEQFAPWSGQHNFGDGMTALEHARAHRAAMSPERRAELDQEWLRGAWDAAREVGHG